MSSGSLTPSEATIRRLADLEESEEDEEEEPAEGEGTAKVQVAATQSSPTSSPGNSPGSSGDWRGTFSQARLSTMFEGWLPSGPAPVAPIESPAQSKRISISVSEPIPVPAEPAESESDDLNEFEEMMVE